MSTPFRLMTKGLKDGGKDEEANVSHLDDDTGLKRRDKQDLSLSLSLSVYLYLSISIDRKKYMFQFT